MAWAWVACMTATAATAAPDEVAADRSVFERYMMFDQLVDRCSVPTHWLSDGTNLWYTDRTRYPTQVSKFDAARGRSEPLLDMPRLRQAIAAELGTEPPVDVLPFDVNTLEMGDGSAEFVAAGTRLRLNLADYSVHRVAPPEAVEISFGTSPEDRFTPRSFRHPLFMVGEVDDREVLSPDRAWFASLRDNNIWLRSTVDGRAVPLTHDGTGEVAWDFETGVRPAWSPNGWYLFARKFDRSRVPKIPVLHMLKPVEELQSWAYQRAGAPLDKAELYIVPARGKEPVHIELGDTTDQYFRELGWLPDSSAVLFARFSRDFKRVDVLAADAVTGATRVILTETSPTFVRIQHEIIWSGGDAGFTLLPSGKQFLWQSERDGWRQLYLYDLHGKLLRQLTMGELPVQGVTAVDEQDGWVYFTAGTEARPYDAHLYRVALQGGKAFRLTEGDGTHRVRLSPSRKVFVDTWSSVSRAPRTEVRSVEGRLLHVLGETDTSRLRSIGWTAPEEFTVKAADGRTPLWGVMYKPYDFDPARRYPLIEYIYGGPQIHNLPTDFCGSGSPTHVDPAFPRALAQMGYLVVVVAGRGTPGRSKAFQDVAYGDWAEHVVADHAAAVRQLGAARSYVDLDRVGVFGRSWGGYFSFRLLADAGDLYQAAVSIVPGFDPYGGILYEPYLGLPEHNLAAYQAAAPFRLAPKIKGNLLMIGGTLDTSTYHDILKMANALVEAHVHHELLILPNQEHMYGGNAAAFARDEIIRFFDKSLRTRQ